MTHLLYSKQTYIYKTVQNCQLHADVYTQKGSDNKPGIIWIHGGGLIFGNRMMLPSEQIALYIEAGYTIISIDYRLAPETKLKGIIEDVQDAYIWAHSKGKELFGIDPDRLSVIGHSSGGYLALMCGFHVYPRPKAIISFYGYGDITGKWCCCPNLHYSKEALVPPEIAYQGVSGQPITGSQFTGFKDQRWLFYLFCRQQGLWKQEIIGHDFLTTPTDIIPFCPTFNITNDYPPTLLLHGDQDIDVPVEESQQMALSLKNHDVLHQLIIMNKFGHIFDIAPDTNLKGMPAGLKHPKVGEVFNKAIAFLNQHLRKRNNT